MFPSIGQFFARLFHKLFPPETQGCHYINGPETLPPPLTWKTSARGPPAPESRLSPTTCGWWCTSPKNSKAPAPVWRI